ncbi:MAG TPA: hypothetical protein DIS71_01660 [Rhodobacter sp.]|nr:hypothetical protein [Rhodobacter sp.]
MRDFSDARLREKAALWQAAVIDALASRVGTGERPLTQQSFYLPHGQTHFYETRRKKKILALKSAIKKLGYAKARDPAE